MTVMDRHLAAAIVIIVAASAGGAGAARGQDVVAHVTGEIASLALVPDGEAPPGASIVVGGVRAWIPPGVAIELPATRMSIADLFRDAPAACRARGESGLAQTDACRIMPDPGGDPALATVLSSARAALDVVQDADGRLVASRVAVTRSVEPLMGGVTFVNADAGYIRINGYYREDFGGTIVRINDPTGQQSVQDGPGCGSEGNCSPDRRFQIDTGAFSVRFERGNPACIGTDAQACPRVNRLVPADDAGSRVPILIGDNVTAEGSFEVLRGVRLFSAQSLLVQAVLPADR